jgi:hypothetical protein
MTLDASTQSTPTAMTSVASALQIPVIFGAEVRWDFLVAPAGKTDPARSRFRQARRGARRVQSKAGRESESADFTAVADLICLISLAFQYKTA